VSGFIQVEGGMVRPDQLEQTDARRLAEHVASGRHPFVRVIECRRADRYEAVIFEVEIEIDQEPVYDIRHVERIALIFAGDGAEPTAFALRHDFPPVPHLILGPPGSPKHLCLYDIPWSEARVDWTPAAFIERVRHWLARTARGELHAPDQLLEPLLAPTPYTLVLPAAFFNADQDEAAMARLSVRLAESTRPQVLIARQPAVKDQWQGGVDFVLTGLRCQPQQHGVVRYAPPDLAGLHDLVAQAGCDLLGVLRGRIGLWAGDADVTRARLIIAVAMPKTRDHDGEVEAEDVWAFLTSATLAEVGLAIGCLESMPSYVEGAQRVARMIRIDESKRGEDVGIELVAPVLALDRRAAARASGRPAPDDRRILAVGCGALGSHVVTNLAREAFGLWTLIDPDHLLPHNVARHAAMSSAVGHAKVDVLACLMGNISDGQAPTMAIQADVLAPGDAKEELGRAYASADLIVDMSASVAVARHLAHDVASHARRVSLFFNPAGTDLVVLAEDAARTIRLDALEMQHYQATAAIPELDGHLAASASGIRYARSCRDVSSAIPESRVALLAAIAGAELRRVADDPAATVAVWRVRDADLGVDPIRPAARPVNAEAYSGWQVVADKGLIERLRQQRAERLPNETGGVLIGSFDVQRSIVHVVEMVPSPADSEEWPTLYIRGAQGLADRVEHIQASTLHRLRYVGEWHSHPDGVGCDPSSDDLKVLDWVSENMAAEGLPGIMAIVGETGHRFFVQPTAGDGEGR
jgi:proteasome lid subunit RPN8/RPN11